MRRIDLKNILKKIVFKMPLLKRFFVSIYQWGGRQPWSMGYSVYKYSYIANIVEKHLDYFSGDTLPEEYGYGLDERVVEYPWFFSRLKAGANVILDAGSTLNHTDILSISLLRGRKLYISSLDFEGFASATNVPFYVYEDLRQMSYKGEVFDAIACISTLEHIGMDNTHIYMSILNKKENEKYAFLDAIREFQRILKPRGVLYLSVPYGKYRDHRWLQVFDQALVNDIKREFSPSEFSETYFKYENGQWNFSSVRACQDSIYFDIHHTKRHREDRLAASQSIVCLELVK